MRWGLLVRNPADSVEPPTPRKKETVTWTAQQAAAFLKAVESDELAALWRLALLTGMRRGELLGLRWEDVNLAGGALAVTRTFIRQRNENVEGTPKTAAGRRQIALPRSMVLALRSYQARQLVARCLSGPGYEDHRYVFADPFGNPLVPALVTKRFLQLGRAAGLPRIRFHDLWHTHATLMLANGEHPKIVQERLGHADVGMTLNRYSHVTPDMQQVAADRLDRLIEDVS